MKNNLHAASSAYVLNGTFFIWGVMTALTSVSVPYVKDYYALSNTGSGLITLIFFMAPFIASIPMGILMMSQGYKRALKYSYGLAMLGAGVIIVAVNAHSFAILCAGVLCIALAVCAMQVVANPYLASLGSAESVPGRLSLASSINSLGTVVAPLCAALLLGGFYQQSPQEQGGGLTQLYLVLLLFITGLLLLANLVQMPDVRSGQMPSLRGEGRRLARDPFFVFSVLAIFCYVGAEVAIGVNAVVYMSDPELGRLSIKEAASLIALYWAGAMLGRFVYGLWSHRLNIGRLLMICTASPVALILLAMFLANETSAYLFLLIGLTNSIIYPVVYSMVINNIDQKLIPMASAILIMAGLGGAVIPFVQAMVSDAAGLIYGFAIPLLSYLYLFYYAVSHRRWMR